MTGETGTGSPDEGETVHQVNARLRYEWLEATLAWTTARDAGETEAAQVAFARREDIQREFFTRNRPLAMSASREFLTYARGDLAHDYEQAAMMALWEAFVGTDPEKVNQVIVEDDGTLRGAAGWNPAQSTFGGFSRKYIRGNVQRAVASSESGLSYAMWTNRPQVLAVKNELAAKLGREPSVDEVARATSLPRDSIRAVLTPPTVSTSTPLGEGFTLGDTLADAAASLSDDDVDLLSEWVAEAAEDIRTIDLFSMLLRKGLMGNEPLKVVDAAARLGVGRGTVTAGVARAWPKVVAAAAASPEVARLRVLAAADVAAIADAVLED